MITLAIIGVVAAITMPVLIKEHQKQQTVAKLKKAYNTISNALQMSRLDNGNFETWELGSSNTLQDASNFTDKYLIPYLNVLKVCKTNTTGECSYSYKKQNNETVNLSNSGSRIFLADGTEVIIDTRNGLETEIPRLVDIYVDINGNKTPNKLGKDLFILAIALETTNDKFKPIGRLNASGQSQSADTIKNNCLTKGTYFAAYIIRNGWKIPNDYPW